MAREGYSLASDRVEPMYPETEGSSSSQQRSTINQSAGAFGLSSSTSTPGLLPCLLSPMTGNTSALNSSQLLSKQIPSGAQLLPAENVVSSPQFTSSCSPKLEPAIAAQFSSLTLEMQEIMNRRSELQLQLKQRHRHQELLMQRRAMLGAPTATTGLSGSPRLGGRNGIQGVRNFSIGSSGNVTGPMASKPNILGGHTLLSGNIGQKNNLSSNTFGLNDSNQLLASSSGYLAAVSYMLGPADGQLRGLEGGVPIQRNDLLVPINNPKVPGVPLIQRNDLLVPINNPKVTGVPLIQRNDLLVPINSPKVPEIPCTLGSQHQVQMQMYQHEVQRPQPCMLQQQDIRLLIDNLQSVNFATQQVGSSPTHLSPQQFSQQPQINQHYKNPGSVLEEMNTRNTMGSQGRVERGWKMHGAANGSKKI
ncbi:hypothetical protein TorRG33x02_172610 [Trema orientale]|uniref:Uncharacterized protein n=1 Tax=Trema orientale TaxID=63057 RepID=A0A2P5EN82_TREOI|nr:hypothetical protein TorRG33x02_172610 [Trema orientale]